MKIFKYPLKLTDEQSIEIPRNHKILSVQIQMGVLCLWAAVEPEGDTVFRTFLIVGTGCDMPEEGYIATVQDGTLVWHIFSDFNNI